MSDWHLKSNWWGRKTKRTTQRKKESRERSIDWRMEEKDKRERKKKKYNRKTNQRKDISDVMITMIYDITKYIARNCGLDGQNCIPSSSSTYYAWPRKLAQAITIVNCVWKMPSSNIGRTPAILTEISSWFSSVPQGNMNMNYVMMASFNILVVRHLLLWVTDSFVK